MYGINVLTREVIPRALKYQVPTASVLLSAIIATPVLL